MLMDELEIEVMQDDLNSLIFNKEKIKTNSIEWYVHNGLTEDIINYSYSSNNIKKEINEENYDIDDIKDYKLYRIKNVDYLIRHISLELKKNNSKLSESYKSKRKELKKLNNKLCFMKSDEIHFNGIEVVDYEKDKNNSFTWQKIPENEQYSDFKNTMIKNYDESNNNSSLKERIKFNKVNLSKSSYQQFGFILKAVIKGELLIL